MQIAAMRTPANLLLQILMADDSADDVFFVRRALGELQLGELFGAVSDGQQVIDYLSGQGKFEDRTAYPFPNLLLLDLKMPGVDGFGVLEWVKAHPDKMIIPTLVFSSSVLETDLRRAYELGASSYLVKPSSPDELRELMRATHEYWRHCHIPQNLGKTLRATRLPSHKKFEFDGDSTRPGTQQN